MYILTHNGLFLSHKEEEIYVIVCEMDGSGDYHDE
jgi:hypothetical protein